MTVAVVMDFEGATLEQYDQVIEKMGFKRGGPGAPGAFGHWVMKTHNGIRVTHVWETKEKFEAFGQEKIGPLTAAGRHPEPADAHVPRSAQLPHAGLITPRA